MKIYSIRSRKLSCWNSSELKQSFRMGLASGSTIWLKKRLFLNLLVVFLDTMKLNIYPKAANDQADEQTICTFSRGGRIGSRVGLSICLSVRLFFSRGSSWLILLNFIRAVPLGTEGVVLWWHPGEASPTSVWKLASLLSPTYPKGCKVTVRHTFSDVWQMPLLFLFAVRQLCTRRGLSLVRAQ